MKKKQKIEVWIERRELSIYSVPHSSYDEKGRNQAGQRDTPPAPPWPGQPESCPVCGSTEMVFLADAMGLASPDEVASSLGSTSDAWHLQCSAAGEWWVCRPSYFPPP